MKKKEINSKYDRFGGHSSEPKDFYIKNPAGSEGKVRPRDLLAKQAEDYQLDKPIHDEVAKELDEIFGNPAEKKQWQRDLSECLKAKAAYEKRKTAGKPVKDEDDPLPLKYAKIEPVKHRAVFRVILAFWHRAHRKGFNSMITNEIRAIWPDIEKKMIIACPEGWFLEQALRYSTGGRQTAESEQRESKNGHGETDSGMDIRGNEKRKTEDRQVVSLKEFMQLHCDLSKNPVLASKADLLHEYNRKQKLKTKLPKTAYPYKRGQTRLYYADELKKNWPAYKQECPTLPRLNK